MAGFYLPPGPNLEPGDIFSEIPFPALRYPLEYFRPSTKNPREAQVLDPTANPPKDGDTAKGPFRLRPVILLSHGCELDGVDRDVARKHTTYERRYWLAAPLLKLSDSSSELMKERTRNGDQPNKFYLPATEFLGHEEGFVDFRKITPINCRYFLDGRKICGLTEPAVLAMQAHLGLFFSGLILYVQPIPCPQCRNLIDPTLFVRRSEDKEDID